jgi:glycosyltransferase involved in cell wall biosynthesis
VRPAGTYTASVTRRLSILHVIDRNRLNSGSPVQLLSAARALAGRGHRVWVASRPGGDLAAACEEAGITFVALPFRRTFALGSAIELRRFLRKERIEIVHVHKGGPHAVALMASPGLGRRPRVVVNRGVSFPLDRFNRWKYRHPRVAAVVCVADAVREVVLESSGVPRTLVHTIRGGTDVGDFDPIRVDGEAVRGELGIHKGQILVGQVSVRDWKGWSDLLRAFTLTTPGSPELRLLFVGCEPDQERTKVIAAASEAGVADRVLTLPYRRDIPAVLAACDVVVDASHTGTGITGTIREAMALGRSVIATDCGGNRELVVDGEVGLLVPPHDPDALAGALSRWIGDPELRSRLGTAARRRVVEHFSTEHRVDKLEALYQNILNDDALQRSNVER